MTGSITTQLVTDQICLSARLFRVCAQDVEFNVITDSNRNIPDGLNIFGITPRSLTEGPAFVDLLYQQGMIKESIAVLNINPHTRNFRSKFVLGGVPPSIEDELRSDWFHHSYKMKKISPYTEHVPALDLTKAIFGNQTLFKSDSQYIVVNSNEQALLRLGSGAQDVFNGLISQLSGNLNILC